ncbi:unnamed protein product [Amoebophrya sp. A25]|nr:unnamed protein product [Amoebophrya sp. A25]|eukprot:GSA25T00021403001.1
MGLSTLPIGWRGARFWQGTGHRSRNHWHHRHAVHRWRRACEVWKGLRGAYGYGAMCLQAVIADHSVEDLTHIQLRLLQLPLASAPLVSSLRRCCFAPCWTCIVRVDAPPFENRKLRAI